ncbi:Ig-like domain-containing protein [Sunxiuqinia sp. A32]|uniref:Ig-like domain-containing protein n=1 Tax=Sunxiuqinia sp. A32 TaxID=3461496 RepID=UPI0040460F0C
MKVFKYIWMIMLLAVTATVTAQESYVIDEVCIGAERYYRIDGEEGSIYEWMLTDSLGNETNIVGTPFSEPDTINGGTKYGSEVSISWDNTGAFTLSSIQTSIYGCDTIQAGEIIVFEQPDAFAGNPQIICPEDSVELFEATAANYSHILWIGGDGTFNNDTILQPVYTPGPNDVLAGSVVLTMSAEGEGSSATCTTAISTVNITLIPIESLSSTLDTTICESDLPFTWLSADYDSTGVYQDTLVSAFGCDSILTLNLSILPITTSITDTTICETDLPFVWNGIDYITSGAYNDTIANIFGCDSVMTLNLTVNPTSVSITDTTICELDLPFVWNGIDYSAAGTYNDTIDNEFGCDSVMTLNLTINPTTLSVIDTTICEADLPFVWNGIDYITSGSFNDTINNTMGCDSVMTLNLSITPTTFSVIDTTICESDLPFAWNGVDYIESGSFNDTIDNAMGCDSVMTLNLLVNPETASVIDTTICETDLPFVWNGIDYITSGSFNDTIANSFGCDSVMTLNLTVNPASVSVTDTTICEADLPFAWNGVDYPIAGTYNDTINNVFGCDSVMTLNLFVNPETVETTTLEICSSQVPFNWNSLVIDTTGIYTDTLTNALGCDSIVTVDLTVLPELTTVIDTTICDSELPFNWSGVDYSAAGVYSDTLISSFGCDSIITLNLFVNPETASVIDTTICETDLPFIWNGIDYISSGSFNDTITNSFGCDSVMTLNLTVNPTSVSVTDTTICESDLPFVWNGVDYPVAGTYNDTIDNVFGCDSVMTLNLFVNPETIETTTLEICSSQVPFNWNSLVIDTTGIYTDTLTNALGCDSIVTVDLTVLPELTTTIDTTICDSELPFNWNGVDYSAAGVYSDTLISSFGCDSIITLNLFINPETASVIDTTICETDLPFVWNGVDYIASGTFNDTIANTFGCDSVMTLNLTVNPASVSVTDTTICESELPFAWNGVDYPIAGTYNDTIDNVFGCDSVMTLNLSVNPETIETTTLEICSSQVPFNWNSLVIDTTGIYTDTLTNALGCDSIVTVDLTVLPELTTTIDTTVCDSELPFIWNGVDYNTTGAYSDTLISSFGCDSIITLNLFVNPETASVIDTTICETDLPFVWNGIDYIASGSFNDTIANTFGCDSVMTLNLTVNPVSVSVTDTTICETDLPFVWNGVDYIINGTYTDTLTNVTGCDSVATLELTIIPEITETENIEICQAQLPLTWNSLVIDTAGVYIDTLTNVAGCDSIVTLTLTISPEIRSEEFIEICEAALPYDWNGHIINAAGSFTDSLTNIAGCDSIATLNLTVFPEVQTTEDIQVCTAQLPYEWNSYSIDTAGVYIDTLATMAGCDSIVTLNFSIAPELVYADYVQVCNADLPYSWNGLSINSEGTYSDTLTNIAGCDSIIVLNLEIAPAVNSDSIVSICSSELPFVWNDIDYNTSGTYVFDTLTSNGCDSTATLYLTVLEGSTSVVNVSVCQSELPYNWNGNDYYTGGTFTYSTMNAAGCDSTETLNLNIKLETASTTNIEVCDAQLPYNWNGISISAEGTYEATLTNSAGCDSTATLNLSIAPIITNTVILQICDSEIPYAWNGQSITTSGIYKDTLTNVAGCDSIAILDLTVAPSVSSVENIYVCSYDLPYNWNGTLITSSGTYTANLTSTAGCDSIATLNVDVTDLQLSTVTHNVDCKGDNSGKIVLYINGGSGNYDIMWSNGETTQNLSNLAAGSYSVTVIDKDGGCQKNLTTWIYEPALNDTEGPIVVAPDDIHAECDTIINAYVDYGEFYAAGGRVSDNLGYDQSSFELYEENIITNGNQRIIERIYAIYDHCDNIGLDTMNIIIEDTTPPVAVCHDITISINENGVYELTQVNIDTIAQDVSDNCTEFENLDISFTPMQFDCSLVGESVTGTLIVVDESGNVDSCQAVITITDEYPPVITCQDIDLYVDENGETDFNINNVITKLEDNCGIDTVIVSRTNFACAEVGINNENIIVYDVHGLADSCDFKVTVHDTIRPTLTCNDYTITLDASEYFKLDASMISSDYWDNCGIDTVMLSKTEFGCEDVGDTPVTVTIIDVNNNRSECIAIVTVVLDNEPPVANDDDGFVTVTAIPIDIPVLDNDSDNDALVPSSLAVLTAPAHGSVTINSNNEFVYTSDATYVGFDEFTYIICDEGIPCYPLCDTARVTVEVLPPNNPPVANMDRYEAGCYPINEYLLVNDYDPDGDEIIINTDPITNPFLGNVTLFDNGDFRYEFERGISGQDWFIYEICDDNYFPKCDTAIVYIYIFTDFDCDNIADTIDIDDDNDGIIDVVEGDMNRDSDGDGIPDSLDIDSDNDGIPDNIEAQAEGNHINPSGYDENRNGLDDIYETDRLGIDPTDTDRDGQPDYLDLDTDNDGVPDNIEGYDIAAKGIAEILPEGFDDDGDGLDDAFDHFFGGFNENDLDNAFGTNPHLQDFDSDGIRDWRDTDDDDDDIPTIEEDLNNNGVYFDDDLDYDGHPEYLDYRGECEMFIPEGFSPDGDGIHDYFQIYCMEKYTNARLMIFDRYGNMVYEKDHYGNREFWGSYEDSWWNGETTRNHLNTMHKVEPEVYLYILDKGNGKLERGFVMVSY